VGLHGTYWLCSFDLRKNRAEIDYLQMLRRKTTGTPLLICAPEPEYLSHPVSANVKPLRDVLIVKIASVFLYLGIMQSGRSYFVQIFLTVLRPEYSNRLTSVLYFFQHSPQ
jgi:hypothetical protein